MKKIRVIINPISGSGRQKKAEYSIRKHLNAQFFESEILYSEYAGHLSVLAQEAANKNYDAVVVVGGDGSVNEATQALTGTKTALGIIPIGSGNGLARFLKIPMNSTKAVHRINLFERKQIDTADINAHKFVNLAGVGFDAHVAKQFELSHQRGFRNYAKISLREFFKYREQDYTISLDGKLINTKAFMIVFANSNQFGNNFVIAPQAKIDDAMLDVCIIKKPKLYQIPIVLLKIMRKKVHTSHLVIIHKASEISIDLHKTTIVNKDGEALEQDKQLRIKVNPLSLSVII
ncbi:MAG: YegS/Rv2252/BmrU family lipid kinase [Bacteroidales bacterium]|nr:YegS/Rv2252/BmrU family lipid kinase [Bacteroidales bacterium]